ncbi:MAG: hypothetical protein PVH88_11150 [Ignavibacteria bacterium]
MTRIVFAAVTIIILLQSSLNAQSLLFDKEGFFNSIFMQKYKINSYYTGNNPAFLDEELSDQRLLVETAFENRHGDFRPFIMPEDQSEFQMSFTGKKQVSENGIFKGSAGYKYEIRNNWDWIASKNYERAKPFLFGDSTSGSTRYNSILLNAQYSTLLPKDIRFGLSLDYAVDDGLKKVTPKPASKHRDIMLNIGLGYDLSPADAVGVTLKYYDRSDEIEYDKDESSVYDEIKVLKFTGYDYPMVYCKQTEERLSFTNGYLSSVDFHHESESFIAAASFTAGFDKQVVKDDKDEHDPQGFSKCNYVYGEANLLYRLSNPLTVMFKYQYDYTEIWAKYADYNVLIMEEETPSHFFNFGLEYAANVSLSLGIEAGIRLHDYDMNDYYSAITASSEGKEYLAKIGLEYTWNEFISTTCGFAYNKNDLSKRVLEYGDMGSIFLNFSIKDILYKITPYSSYAGYIKNNFNIKGIGEITFNIIYSQADPEDEAAFEGFDKKNINAWIQFRTQVY